jgi:hypothetical protein
MPPTQKVPRTAALFEVAPSGTLSLAGVDLPGTRASAYDLSPERLRNAADLLSAAAGCPPLAWHLHHLYNEAREAHAAELARLLAAESEPRRRRTLAARLHLLSPEPGKGLAGWLESLSGRELRSVVKSVHAWLEEEPA